MAATVSVLPRIFRWIFMVLAIFAGVGAGLVFAVILINPHLPLGAHFGPFHVNLLGESGAVTLRAAGADSNLIYSGFRGGVTFVVVKAQGLVELMKDYGLPLMLARLLFFAAIFELLRRLFRNVGRGESFSQDTVRLVQAIAGVLIVYAFVISIAASLLAHAIYGYLAQHAIITVSGTTVHLPLDCCGTRHYGFGFDGAILFSGLLVLALSEVFRQGLALKKEQELTI